MWEETTSFFYCSVEESGCKRTEVFVTEGFRPLRGWAASLAVDVLCAEQV